MENIGAFCRLRGIRDSGTVRDIMKKLSLTRYENVRAANLSQGNSQRLGLAKAMLHNPEVLILDEPSNGLDPSGIVEIREMLKELAFNSGVTILVSSHNLSEITKLATRIGIIHNGKLLQEIDADKLDGFLRRSLLLDTRNRQETVSFLADKGISAVVNEKSLIEILDEKAIMNPDEIASMLASAGYPPVLLKVEQEDLETYFLRTIGEIK
jgi:ABC-2 type transport system ATP-binding protein